MITTQDLRTITDVVANKKQKLELSKISAHQARTEKEIQYHLNKVDKYVTFLEMHLIYCAVNGVSNLRLKTSDVIKNADWWSWFFPVKNLATLYRVAKAIQEKISVKCEIMGTCRDYDLFFYW